MKYFLPISAIIVLHHKSVIIAIVFFFLFSQFFTLLCIIYLKSKTSAVYGSFRFVAYCMLDDLFKLRVCSFGFIHQFAGFLGANIYRFEIKIDVAMLVLK